MTLITIVNGNNDIIDNNIIILFIAGLSRGIV